MAGHKDKKWTNSDMLKLRMLYALEVPLILMSEVFGRDKKSISKKAKRLFLTHNYNLQEYDRARKQWRESFPYDEDEKAYFAECDIIEGILEPWTAEHLAEIGEG